jgi:hypothetical protein
VHEPPVAMVVVEDPYGFDTDIGDKIDILNRERERLRALEPSLSDVKSSGEFITASDKVKQTPAYLELAKSIEEKQAALKCRRPTKNLTAERIARG